MNPEHVVPLAHAGHWIEAAIYLVPILGFGAWLGVTTIRDKRKRRAGEGVDEDAETHS
jgi:hypothetical protein